MDLGGEADEFYEVDEGAHEDEGLIQVGGPKRSARDAQDRNGSPKFTLGNTER